VKMLMLIRFKILVYNQRGRFIWLWFFWRMLFAMTFEYFFSISVWCIWVWIY
jgi:hypothetical protein